MNWYLCWKEGSVILVLSKVSYENLFISHPFEWNYAINSDSMEKVLQDKKFNVVFYQKEFEFD